MKQLSDITLSENQHKALIAIKNQMREKFEVDTIIIYGSVARGTDTIESDLDLLIITPKPLERKVRHQITDLIFDVNLQYDTNVSSLVVDLESWENGVVSILPIHDEIVSEGIAV